jgi:F0F1-type ATP synthase assembly protein I
MSNNLPEPPSAEEIQARLRRAIERTGAIHPDDDMDLHERLLQATSRMDSLSQIPDTIEAPKIPLPEDDVEIAARLKELEARTEKAKVAREAAIAKDKRSARDDQKNSKGLGLGMTVAYMLTGVPIGGAFLGWLIDRQLHTIVWKGYCALLGAFIGLAMVIITLNRNADKN